jgi:hypothetical protein
VAIRYRHPRCLLEIDFKAKLSSKLRARGRVSHYQVVPRGGKAA